MSGVCIDGRTVLYQRVDIRDGDQYLYSVSGQGLSHGELIQVTRVIVVDGSPKQTEQVSNSIGSLVCCRMLQPFEFSQRFRRKIRQQAALKHGLVGYVLQDGAVIPMV
jgi:hypothetical protein